MVNRKNIAQWLYIYIQSKTIMSIQHFDPMSSYPGLPLYIIVDYCNYKLIIRGIKSPHEFIYKVSNYSFTIWYKVFYKHSGGTAIFRLI